LYCYGHGIFKYMHKVGFVACTSSVVSPLLTFQRLTADGQKDVLPRRCRMVEVRVGGVLVRFTEFNCYLEMRERKSDPLAKV
jgi:hypothetical protein